nr:MAG TPA: Peptidase [Caudoviricetes sp.]
MGVLTVSLRRADNNNKFADVYMQSMTPLIKMAAESDETLDKALDKRLPEEVDTVPSTLVVGKMVSVKGVLYVGGPTGAPVKVTYSHPTSSGNKHLPAGGTKGQYLTNADGEGGGEWADLPAASTTKAGIVQLSDGVTVADATKAATANAVKKAYDKANHSHPYVPTSQVGAKGGVAPLDENGIISSTYLPSYVDDVIDGTISDDLSTFTDADGVAVTPEAGKIYNDTTKNKSYRWSGTTYVSLNDGVALGETENTAYRGDRGKVAYEHSQSTHARADATKTEKSNTNGNVKINGSEVTVYTHPTDAGNKHLPAAGTVNQYLKNTAAGTGAWESADTEPTADSVKLITSGAVAQVKTDLTAEIGKKADSSHTHAKAEVGLGNVDNKSSETIRSEITSKNVTDALGFTPIETVPEMKGATFALAGKSGLVPKPTLGTYHKFLRGDGTWQTPADTTYGNATTSTSGLMSAADKKKLDGIATGATKYSHPTYTAAKSGLYKVTVDSTGHVSGTTPVAKADITKLGIPSQDTTYNDASATSHGLMSADDKMKLDGIEAGANKTTVSTEIAKDDTNPVAGGAVWNALSNKANASSLANKQDKVTGAATTIVSDDLTAGRVVVSDESGKVAVSDITAEKLGYLSGVTSDIQTQIDAKAPLASPAFTGKPTAVTPDSTDNGTRLATTAFVQAVVSGLLDAKDAFHFVGTLAGDDTLPAAESGHVYRITSDGTINGLTVHQGDTITCCVDGTKAGTPANWFVTHTNHDGQVMGPTSAVDSHVAVYDGATGKLIKDSGFTIGASVPADAKFTDTVYTHPSSGVSAASYGPSANATPSYGATFSVPYVTVNAQGHITAAVTRTVKIPAAPTSVTGNAGTATKLATARKITFTGGATGSVSFDGSTDVSCELTVAGGSDVYSSTQPTDQSAGDYWYEPISAVNS